MKKKIVEEEKNFTLAISYHSGTEAILYPWGYTTNPAPDNDTFIFIGNLLKNFTKYTLEQGSNLYPVSGEWGDWLYGTYNVTAFTIEVYVNRTEQGKLYAPPTKKIDGKPYIDVNITAYFNPSGRLAINSICKKNLYAVVAASILLLPPIPQEKPILDIIMEEYGVYILIVVAVIVAAVIVTFVIKKREK